MSKDLAQRNLNNENPVDIQGPTQQVGQSAKGRYKYEVRDNAGVVYDSGDWKPNLILDCGLDKLADMAWAQTFQWAVVGTNSTPTVDKYEDTGLTVKLMQSPNCDALDIPDDLKCFESPEQPLIIEAIAGCREAPVEPFWYDQSEGDYSPNVPVYAQDEQRAFGRFTDVGKTIYLRDENLQFKVLSSCPAYSITPLRASGTVVSVSGTCGSLLSAAMWPDVDPNGTDNGVSLNTGAGYFSAGSGGARKGIRIPPGDPEIPILTQAGSLNAGTGVRVSPPNGRGAVIEIKKSGQGGNHTGLEPSDVKLKDGGAGYGHEAGSCFDITTNIARPAYSTGHFGLWANTNVCNLIYQTPGLFVGNGRPANTMVASRLGEDRHARGDRHGYDFSDQTMYSSLAFTANSTEFEHVWGNNYDTDIHKLMAQMIFVEHFCSYRKKHDDLNGNTSWNQYVAANIFGPGSGSAAKITSPGPNKTWGYGYSLIPGFGYGNSLGVNKRESLNTSYGTTDGQKDQIWGNGLIEQAAIGQSSLHSNVGSVVSEIESNWSNAANLKAGIQAGSIGSLPLDYVLRTHGSFDMSSVHGDKRAENAFSHPSAPAGEWVDISFKDPTGSSGLFPQNWWLTSSKHKVGGVHPTLKLIESGSLPHGAAAIGHTAQINSADAFATAPRGRGHISPNVATIGTRFGQVPIGQPMWLDRNRPDTAGFIGQGAQAMGDHHLTRTSTDNGDMVSLSECVKWGTDEKGVITSVSINPTRWLWLTFCAYSNMYSTGSNVTPYNRLYLDVDVLKNCMWQGFGAPLMSRFWENAGSNSIFGQVESAEMTMKREGCGLGLPTVTSVGRGYVPNEVVSATVTGPTLKQAQIAVQCDDLDGKITDVIVVDPGSGYSCTEPATITLPVPPPAQILKYNLIVKPIGTYENINNNFFWKSTILPIESKADVYNTDQTYLGQGKDNFTDGTPVYDGEGGYENRGTRYGPCHFVNHNYTKTWTEFDPDETVPAGGTRTPISKSKYITHNQYKTNGWYVTGTDYETNSVYCGTDFLSSGNQVSMTRTFDFYMELQPVTYAEIGFKESPAARELFSRIVFDDPIKLSPGQYLRVSYQLLVTMEPGPTARVREVPSEGTWVNGTRTWKNENKDNSEETINVLSGFECIQGNGIAIVDEHGIATPYDITGLANEPFAPGSYFLGPQQGYVNRWKNGDTRLSFPTREYNNDINNPWILGGDQVNPPDWAIKFFDSPTQNYRPRDFATFLEWPWYQTDIVDYSNDEPGEVKYTPDVNMPPGPEMTLERDAFTHWFTPTFPNNTNYGTITWTNFVANNHDGSGNPLGRWDYHCVKPYVREVYPNMMREPNVHGITVKDTWYEKYRRGDLIAKSGKTNFYSAPGVFPGPVIEYDGDLGGLYDPTSVSTVRYNPLSPTTGGMASKPLYSIRNPYTNTAMKMLEPHNTGFGGEMFQTQIMKVCEMSPLMYTVPLNHWCWKNIEPISRDEVTGPMGLVNRQTDYRMSSIMTEDLYPIWNGYGGGFETLDAFKGWSHTPHINYKEGTTVDDGNLIAPDTAGNWAKADAIPVAGPSAFISTADVSFAVVGEWYNRSHTIFGAVCGVGGDPEHDFDGSTSLACLANPSTDPLNRTIGVSEQVNNGDRCFEAPCFLNDYKRGDHYREKYAEWETSFGNLTGIKCIGLGPTSTTLNPIEMTDAARFNTYVFQFGGGTLELPGPLQAFDNLTTFKLKTTFRHTWYRDLT